MAAGPLFLPDHQPSIARPAPSPPTWMLSEAQCAAAVLRIYKKPMAIAGILSGTGSGPTIKAAMSLPAALWLSPFDPVRADARGNFLGHRGRRRRGARLLWGLDGSDSQRLIEICRRSRSFTF